LTDDLGNTNSVIDEAGNAMSDLTLPSGQNLSDNAGLVIDNTALFTNTSVNISENLTAGDTFALTFNEAVGNISDLNNVITEISDFGASGSKATTAWSNSNKIMTITLGAGENFDADYSLVFASILDLAGNEATSVTYTLDIV